MESEEHLEKQFDQLKEDLFLARTDLEKARAENIALKNFIQNLFESCEAMEETTLTLDEVIDNLKENISVFAKDLRIRL